MYELCFRNIRIFDPANNIDFYGDLAIENGKIAAFGENLTGDALREIHIENGIICPGLVDVHTHTGNPDAVWRAVPVDDCGVNTGVTLIGDAGTAGYANWDTMIHSWSNAKTRVKPFIHIHPYGIKDLPEPWDHPLNFDLCQKKIEESPIPVFGIKIRAIAQFAKRYGVKGLEDVKKFSSSMKLPLMVHTGTEPDDAIPACWEDFTRASCELLEKGDILSHFFTAKRGGLITKDRRFYETILKARQRGVIFDTAVAIDNCNFTVAQQAIEDGLMPDTISTDLTARNAHRVAFDLPTTMSRFYTAGLTIKQIFLCVTHNATLALGEEYTGIASGVTANLTLLEQIPSITQFGEGDDIQNGCCRWIPHCIVFGNSVIPASSRLPVKTGENI